MWVVVAQAAIAVACFALAVFGGTPVVRRTLGKIETLELRSSTVIVPRLTVPGDSSSSAPVTGPERAHGLATADGRPKGGYWIGLLERAALFAVVLSGFPAGIAMVFGVKILGRYPGFRTRSGRRGQVFIVGTISSMLWAALWSGLACALIAALSPATGSSTPPELLPNADFSAGAKGWGTNAASETLTILGGNIAQLSTQTGGSATLNDRPNSLQNRAKGTSYVAKARIRTTTPNVVGALRIREVSGGAVNVSKAKFTLITTSWRVVTLNLTTLYATSHLDLNIHVGSLPVGRNLQVDWVSVRLATTAAAVPPADGERRHETALGDCKPEPLFGSKFGLTLDSFHGLSQEQAWARAIEIYGKPGILRVFYPGAPSGWKMATVAKGVDLSVSFKIQPKDIVSGASDAKLRDWFQSAPNDVPIYWSYFHEPEDDIERGDFTSADYRAAWQRIYEIANETCHPNMHSTLILMDWTLNPLSGRNFADYYPGSAYIDVLSWDSYNHWSGTNYRDPKTIFEKVVSKSKAEGKPFAIAETGSLLMGDDKGPGRAVWLTSMAQYLRRNGALYVSYFDTNQDGKEFRLMDKPSQYAWSMAFRS